MEAHPEGQLQTLEPEMKVSNPDARPLMTAKCGVPVRNPLTTVELNSSMADLVVLRSSGHRVGGIRWMFEQSGKDLLILLGVVLGIGFVAGVWLRGRFARKRT